MSLPETNIPTDPANVDQAGAIPRPDVTGVTDNNVFSLPVRAQPRPENVLTEAIDPDPTPPYGTPRPPATLEQEIQTMPEGPGRDFASNISGIALKDPRIMARHTVDDLLAQHDARQAVAKYTAKSPDQIADEQSANASWGSVPSPVKKTA